MSHLSLLLALLVVFSCTFVLAKPKLPLNSDGFPIIPCMTEEIFDLRHPKERAMSCHTQGICDNPSTRDQYGKGLITVNITLHIMRSAVGQYPDNVYHNTTTELMARLQRAYGPYGISFDYSILEHNDAEFYCIPGYSSTNSKWMDAIESMKKKYAVDPSRTLNVFISCMDVSFAGTLYGIATFPWDPVALTSTGGLWLNGIACNEEAQLKNDATFEHELGHCLGLWHTFHGSDEVLGCNLPCEELPHSADSPQANTVGDFCSDTPATPRDYNCKNPSGTACNGAPWGDVDFSNFMGYGMDPIPCGDHFTTQQQNRMHCWVCNAIPSVTLKGC